MTRYSRVGALARLRLGDLKNLSEHRALRFREKGGKLREIPVRHDLDAWLREYLDAAGIIGQDGKTPLFRVAVVTDLLKQDVPLEDVQYLAGHSNPRATQIYERRRWRVTRNIVERISI